MSKLPIELKQAYQVFLDGVSSFVFIQDVAYQLEFFNQAWLALTGQSLKKALFQNFLDVIHPDDLEHFKNKINAFDEDVSSYVEFRLKNNKHEYRWMCDYRTLLYDASHTCVGYLNMCYDIHDTKLARDEVLVREERYNFAVNLTGIGVWDLILTGPNMNQLVWNDNMFQIFNVDPDDFKATYEDFERCVHPDDREKVNQNIKQCFKTKKVFKTQFRIVTHPGEIRYVSAQAKVSFNAEGRPVRLTGINQDMTSREIEKIKTKELLEMIDENERKYRALFESSSDAIMLLSDNLFVECNDATLSMFNAPDRSHFLGTHPSVFSPHKQPDGRLSTVAADAYIAEARRAGKASFAWTHKRLTGEVFSAEVLLTPVVLKTQDLIQATVRDITALVQLQEKLTFLSTHDQLTGLYNRHGLMQFFSKELNRAKRYAHAFSILMLDIDFFKRMNDTYGHQEGDKVLVHFSQVVSSTIRIHDIAIRFGGEEFLILLPETDIVEAQKLAERIRIKTERATVQLDKKNKIQYTVSIGVAAYPEHGQGENSMLASVDKALYCAKKAGRNQVVISKIE
jgi:diguanylate cyclase (GGDEF)-like protein/PAS domain S-box-containing protein